LAKQKSLEESLSKKGRTTVKKHVQESAAEKGKKRRRDTLTDKVTIVCVIIHVDID
jgi:hypothetical protein